jgi:hypothetical protein
MRSWKELSRTVVSPAKAWPFPVVLGLLCGLSGTILWAQEEPAVEEESTGPQITIHGFLTQAYAQSDGHQFLGINEEGTADYRTAALQIRADIGEDDAFVVQLSHERVGDSPLQTIRNDDVALDWIFYEHRFGNSAVKVGRVQIPFGIYNEVLDVGTLLPFYRPPVNFYGEAAYSTETVDGIVASHRFKLGHGWELDGALHYGNWEFIERNFSAAGYSSQKVRDSWGAELWLNTPVPGLRFGTGGMRYKFNSQNTGVNEWESYHFSVAGDFSRVAVHVEHKDVDVVIGHVLLSYAHLGVNLTDKLTINAQQELAYFKLSGGPRDKFDDDFAVSVNYAFQPSLVLKAEHHWNQTSLWLEDVLPLGPLQKTRYWIASLSTSF